MKNFRKTVSVLLLSSLAFSSCQKNFIYNGNLNSHFKINITTNKLRFKKNNVKMNLVYGVSTYHDKNDEDDNNYRNMLTTYLLFGYDLHYLYDVNLKSGDINDDISYIYRDVINNEKFYIYKEVPVDVLKSNKYFYEERYFLFIELEGKYSNKPKEFAFPEVIINQAIDANIKEFFLSWITVKKREDTIYNPQTNTYEGSYTHYFFLIYQYIKFKFKVIDDENIEIYHIDNSKNWNK